ncbi:hypothetical protein CAPTEDRAFT_217974 [Capitella teleta]|uniref:Uncharacterized protein n=1 Tax=Capitella teleta TaxID=283909 RepID=R7UPK2_CAPTE|nr:hypothetical protein CAPTEDRAFT_217974 [Capitella teleta]|eukprot:ELU08454.1 hypothetical protein CAPTEDRAFT_217974 [Capitella teleta]
MRRNGCRVTGAGELSDPGRNGSDEHAVLADGRQVRINADTHLHRIRLQRVHHSKQRLSHVSVGADVAAVTLMSTVLFRRASRFLANGAPISAVGIQTHVKADQRLSPSILKESRVGRAVRRLYREEWWTNERRELHELPRSQTQIFRVFHGDHTLTVSQRGRVIHKRDVSVVKGQEVIVELDMDC